MSSRFADHCIAQGAGIGCLLVDLSDLSPDPLRVVGFVEPDSFGGGQIITSQWNGRRFVIPDSELHAYAPLPADSFPATDMPGGAAV